MFKELACGLDQKLCDFLCLSSTFTLAKFLSQSSGKSVTQQSVLYFTWPPWTARKHLRFTKCGQYKQRAVCWMSLLPLNCWWCNRQSFSTFSNIKKMRSVVFVLHHWRWSRQVQYCLLCDIVAISFYHKTAANSNKQQTVLYFPWIPWVNWSKWDQVCFCPVTEVCQSKSRTVSFMLLLQQFLLPNSGRQEHPTDSAVLSLTTVGDMK